MTELWVFAEADSGNVTFIPSPKCFMIIILKNLQVTDFFLILSLEENDRYNELCLTHINNAFKLNFLFCFVANIKIFLVSMFFLFYLEEDNGLRHLNMCLTNKHTEMVQITKHMLTICVGRTALLF